MPIVIDKETAIKLGFSTKKTPKFRNKKAKLDGKTFDSVKESLESNGVVIANSNLDLIPSNYVSLPADKEATFQKMIDYLEDNDDVQNVYANFDIDDELMEKIDV